MKKSMRNIFPIFLIIGALLLIIATFAIPWIPKNAVNKDIKKYTPLIYKLNIIPKHPLLLEPSENELKTKSINDYHSISNKYNWTFYIDDVEIKENNENLLNKVPEDLYWSCYWIKKFPDKLLKFISKKGPPSVYLYTTPKPTSCPPGAPACGFEDVKFGNKYAKWVGPHELGHLLTYYCFTNDPEDPLKDKLSECEQIFKIQSQDNWQIEDGLPKGFLTINGYAGGYPEDFCDSLEHYVSMYTDYYFFNFKARALKEFAQGYSSLWDKFNFIKNNIYAGAEFPTCYTSLNIAGDCVANKDISPGSTYDFEFYLSPLVDLAKGAITISLWSKNDINTQNSTIVSPFTKKGALINDGPIYTSFYIDTSNINDRECLLFDIYYHSIGMLMDSGQKLVGKFEFPLINPDEHFIYKYHPLCQESGVNSGLEKIDYFLQPRSYTVSSLSLPQEKKKIIDVDLENKIIFHSPENLSGKLRKIYIDNPDPGNSELINISSQINNPQKLKIKFMKIYPIDKSVWIMADEDNLSKPTLIKVDYQGNLLWKLDLKGYTPITQSRKETLGGLWLSNKNMVFHITPDGKIDKTMSIPNSSNILDFLIQDNTLLTALESTGKLDIKRYEVENSVLTLTDFYYTELPIGVDYGILMEQSQTDNSLWLAYLDKAKKKTSLIKINNSIKEEFRIEDIKGVALQLIPNNTSGSILLNLDGSPQPEKDWLLRFSSKGQLIAADFEMYGYVFEE